ncbi:ER-bound oxygenase mpaB/mpaB'/Rubber oxygenase catalytic domain-containing protein [Sphingomonas antarctica]|uniref:hypothetical protein n=1 Tax=Sphingomonas antarctica TaxID=2040274 RepID=UPI0039EACD43
MGTTRQATGAQALGEIKEFAGFPAATQRFVRRALDVGLGRRDAVDRWSRDNVEAVAIKAQARIYARLPDLRSLMPDDADIASAEPLMAPLITMTAFDLGQDRINGFGAYRFLYERLLGAAVRPWLPAAFCAAASLPHLHPERRRILLKSISEAAATAPGWSNREPCFFPEWVEKIEALDPA